MFKRTAKPQRILNKMTLENLENSGNHNVAKHKEPCLCLYDICKINDALVEKQIFLKLSKVSNPIFNRVCLLFFKKKPFLDGNGLSESISFLKSGFSDTIVFEFYLK